MAQTTINYDKLMEIYANNTAYHPKPKERSTCTQDSLQFLRDICNLSSNDLSDKELIRQLFIGLITGLVTLPLIPIMIIFLEILIAK